MTAAIMMRETAGSTEEPRYAELGRRIAAAREALRWSQREAAGFAEIKPGYWGNIETGIVRPRPEKLRAIARVLNTSYEELASAAGYTSRRAGDDTMPVRPGYRSILEYLQERRTPEELRGLDRLYDMAASLVLKLHRVPEHPADAGSGEQTGEDAIHPATDDETLDGA